MDRGLAIVLTLLTGALVAFQPPANAALARHVSDLGATLTSLTISWLIIAVLLLTVGDLGALKGLSEFRPEHALGGVGGAVIVLVTLIAVGPLGAAGLAAVLVTGQLLMSASIDRLGLLGLDRIELTPARLGGVALLIAGTVLVTSR